MPAQSAGTFTLKQASHTPCITFNDKGVTARLWFRDGVLDYEGELPPSEGARIFIEHASAHFQSLINAEVEKRLASLKKD